jgi:tRNA pseudouridine32 synthase / 23S rRNA pseudouridine746 synthase
MGARDARPCLGSELERTQNCRLWPVHRLDLEVSGLVLFAKSADAHRCANAWFENHTIHKIYQAITLGPAETLAPGTSVEWRSQLARGKRRSFESPHGKLAITRATRVGGEADRLTWLLEPCTGRPHQLRVHLAQHGFPIVGDTLYGASAAGEDGAIMLRAVRLDFVEAAGATGFGLPSRLEVTGLF